MLTKLLIVKRRACARIVVASAPSASDQPSRMSRTSRLFATISVHMFMHLTPSRSNSGVQLLELLSEAPLTRWAPAKGCLRDPRQFSQRHLRPRRLDESGCGHRVRDAIVYGAQHANGPLRTPTRRSRKGGTLLRGVLYAIHDLEQKDLLHQGHPRHGVCEAACCSELRRCGPLMGLLYFCVWLTAQRTASLADRRAAWLSTRVRRLEFVIENGAANRLSSIMDPSEHILLLIQK